MGPGKNRFWLPLGRLSAAFGAVVVALNIFLQAFAPSSRPAEGPQPDYDFLAHKKRQLQRNWRAIQRLFEGPAPETPPLSMPGLHPDWLALPCVVVLPAANPPPGEEVAFPEGPPYQAGLPMTLAETEPPKEEWGWTPRPRYEGPLDQPFLTPEVVAQLRRRCAKTPLADFGNALLRGPEILLDAVASMAGDLFRRRGDFDWREGESESISSRVFDFQLTPRPAGIFDDFVTNLADRERRFLAGFKETDAATPGFQEGSSGLSPNRLWSEERKVVLDALKNTYLMKYRGSNQDRIRDDAFYLSDWRGLDYVVLPPLVGGYLFFRGLEKRVSAGDMWFRVSFEPISSWVLGKRDLSAGVSVEWGIKGIPVGVVASAGRYDGATKVDFIGIGTSLGVVREAIARVRGD
jgi:hypothetical protein